MAGMVTNPKISGHASRVARTDLETRDDGQESLTGSHHCCELVIYPGVWNRVLNPGSFKVSVVYGSGASQKPLPAGTNK